MREANRAGRLRWLGGRRTATETWDAFEALDGVALVNLDRPQPWRSVKGWLGDLAAEVDAGLADGSLPPLSLDRVWITRVWVGRASWNSGLRQRAPMCRPNPSHHSRALRDGWRTSRPGGSPDPYLPAPRLRPAFVPARSRSPPASSSTRSRHRAMPRRRRCARASRHWHAESGRDPAVAPRRVSGTRRRIPCGADHARSDGGLRTATRAHWRRGAGDGPEAHLGPAGEPQWRRDFLRERRALETYVAAIYPDAIANELDVDDLRERRCAPLYRPLAIAIVARNPKVSPEALAEARATLGPFLEKEEKARQGSIRRARIAPFVVPAFPSSSSALASRRRSASCSRRCFAAAFCFAPLASLS